MSNTLARVSLALVGVLTAVTLITALSLSGAASDQQAEQTTASSADVDVETEFTATNSGGVLEIGGDEINEVPIPPRTIEIEGVVDERAGTWESTAVEFPAVDIEGFDVDLEVPDGFEGEFDRDEETISADGEFVISAVGEEVAFDIEASSENPEGSATIDGDSASGELVDETFLVEETGNFLIDGAIGLPADEEGENRIVMPLEFDLEEFHGLDPAVGVETDSVQFDDVGAGETATEQVEIENDGAEPLEVKNLELAGEDFGLFGSDSFTLAPGEQETVEITFAPDQPGAQTTHLTIESNDPDRPTRTLPVSSGDVELDVTLDDEDRTTVSAIAEEVAAGESTEISLPDPPEDEEYQTESINITPEVDTEIEMDVTTSSQPLETTPEIRDGFATNTTMVGNSSVDTNLADEEIVEFEMSSRVDQTQLEEWGTDPGNVSLYRFDESTQHWEKQETEVVEVTDEGVLLEASADHPSEWTAAASRPEFEIAEADVDVDLAGVGETVEIDVFVENTGGTEGTYVADLLLDDERVESKESVIDSGGQALFDFEQTFDESGTYEVQVNEKSITELDVNESVSSDQTDDSFDGEGPGFGIAGAILAVLGLTLLAHRKH